jgi:hypothetical protein
VAPGADEHEHAGGLVDIGTGADAGEEISIGAVVKKAIEKTGVTRVPCGRPRNARFTIGSGSFGWRIHTSTTNPG